MLKSDITRDDQLFLLGHDNDSFARWEAGQTVAAEIILEIVAELAAGRSPEVDMAFTEAIADVLDDSESDKSLLAEALTLPSEGYLGQMMDIVDVDGIHAARTLVQEHLAAKHFERWLSIFRAQASVAPYSLNREEKASRALRNVALSYLMKNDRGTGAGLAMEQFRGADNMTDVMGALAPLASSRAPERSDALAEFYDRWQGDPLVIDKWFSVQAAASRDSILDDVLTLRDHEAFSMTNPNRVRSLVAVFSVLNRTGFHHVSGGGYRFLSETVLELDGRNPQLAARLVQPLVQWKRFDTVRQSRMRAELERLLGTTGLSRDVFELVRKSLD